MVFDRHANHKYQCRNRHVWGRRYFADRLTACRNTDDRRLLEDIAACLREDTSDFLCIDQIICLLSDGGFDTGPRHDFG